MSGTGNEDFHNRAECIEPQFKLIGQNPGWRVTTCVLREVQQSPDRVMRICTIVHDCAECIDAVDSGFGAIGAGFHDSRVELSLPGH
jgi:hypothetical protein